MIEATDVLRLCRSRQLTFFTGVPCSLLKPLINQVVMAEDLNYVAASIEGEAVAIAAGSWLAGQPAVVMLQNSGLGNVVNPITSLTNTYKIPCLLIVSHRGKAGMNDKIQHQIMGRITEDLLNLMGVLHLPFSDQLDRLEENLDTLVQRGSNTLLPTALILPKGVLRPSDIGDNVATANNCCRIESMSQPDAVEASRRAAVEAAAAALNDDDLLISTTGKTSRELFEIADRNANFYMQGSMGSAAGIGLGVALNQNKRVVVLDGDGAALMKLGTMATVGHYQPEKYTHIILDNMSYDSTGGQPSAASSVSFCGIALACGYQRAASMSSLAEFNDCLKRFLPQKGPSLIHMRVKQGASIDLSRPTLTPEQIRDRFRGAAVG